uniref:Uncharacterized protein n=1 Tax=Parascaris univalens TaxID=6257 RepID=A0A914ZXD6_PARUN
MDGERLAVVIFFCGVISVSCRSNEHHHFSHLIVLSVVFSAITFLMALTAIIACCVIKASMKGEHFRSQSEPSPQPDICINIPLPKPSRWEHSPTDSCENTQSTQYSNKEYTSAKKNVSPEFSEDLKAQSTHPVGTNDKCLLADGCATNGLTDEMLDVKAISQENESLRQQPHLQRASELLQQTGTTGQQNATQECYYFVSENGFEDDDQKRRKQQGDKEESWKMQLSRDGNLRSEGTRRSSTKSTDIIHAQHPQSSPEADLSGAQLPHSGAIEMQNTVLIFPYS